MKGQANKPDVIVIIYNMKIKLLFNETKNAQKYFLKILNKYIGGLLF